MKFRLTGIALTVLLFAAGFSTDLAGYLKVRKSLKITQPTTSSALETLVGSTTCEIRGIVKGTIKVDGTTRALLEGVGGSWVTLNLPASETWLEIPNTRARLIVKATRAHDNSMLRGEIIIAIPEEQIAAWEDKQKPVVSSKPPAAKLTTTRSSSGKLQQQWSRSGTPVAPIKNWNLAPNDAVPYYAQFIRSYNKKLSEQQAYQIAHGIVGFSVQYGVDARLITAMVLCESGFNPNDTSRAGAMGLGQLMPGTASGMGVRNAYDIYENLWGTVRLVRGHLDKYQMSGLNGQKYSDLVLALAAYNAGSGAVRKYGGVPPYRETQNYINKVIDWYKKLCGQA